MESDPPPPESPATKASTLDRAMRHGAVDYQQAVSLIVALCEQAAPTHEEGLAYGALSPSSILITSDLELTIEITPVDGPLEEIADEARNYIAPEILSGETCSARGDVYSLGRILYRLISGSTPEGDNPPPASSLSKTPLVLDIIIKRTTSASPDERISSVEKLANDLRQTAQTRPVIKAPEAPITPIRQQLAAAASPTEQPARTNQVVPWSLVAKCAIALVLLALVVKIASRFGNEVEDERPAGAATASQGRKLEQRPDPFAQDPAPRKSVPDQRPSRRPKATPRGRLKDSLQRLKPALASGDRSELPPEAVRRNDSTFALWERTMTWREARAFAEDHGAHLAILKERKDRDWARDRFDMRYPAWLGAGKGANDHWYWLDGTPLPKGRSVGKPEDWHLALTEKGILLPADPERKCDVLLEWRDDGENPGTEQEQLRRVKRLALSGSRHSLVQGVALPIGTRTFGNSHFYALRSPMISWGEALDFAAIHGAYLGVPSSTEEHKWICSNFWDYLGTGQGLWIGGFRAGVGQPWKWVSGEAWNGAGLVEGGNPHPLFDRILLQGGGEPGDGRWTMVEGGRRKAPGILLEWRASHDSTTDQGTHKFDSNAWLAAITRKTQQTVGSDLSAFDWSKRKLVEQYERELKKHIRQGKSAFRSAARQPGQNQAQLRTKIEKLESLEQSLGEASAKGQLLSFVPEEGEILRTTHQQAVGALETLEEKHDDRIKALLLKYRSQIEDRASALLAEGHLEKASDLRNVLRPLKSDLKAFLRLLYPENADRAKLRWEARETHLKEED